MENRVMLIPSWHRQPPPPSAGPRSWCLQYRLALAAGIAAGVVLLTATVLALIVLDLQRDATPLPAWVDALRTLGRGDWYARRSGLGLVAAVYYTVVPLLFPLSLFITWVLSTYTVDGRLKEWIERRRDMRGLIACWIVMINFPLIGGLFLHVFNGSNARRLHIADDPAALLLQGWIPFAALGAVAAMGPISLQIVWPQMRR